MSHCSLFIRLGRLEFLTVTEDTMLKEYIRRCNMLENIQEVILAQDIILQGECHL